MPIRCDNDVDLLGYSLAFAYETSTLEVTDVLSLDTSSEGAEFFRNRVDPVAGLVACTVVFDLEGIGSRTLLANTNHVMAIVVVDVLAPADATTPLTFQDVVVGSTADLPVSNVMTDTAATSILPTLVNGTLRIETDGGDGDDVGDAVFILLYLFAVAPAPDCLAAADIDDSGDLTITDPIYLLNAFYLPVPPPAPPFPSCGTDPTPDLLSCESYARCP